MYIKLGNKKGKVNHGIPNLNEEKKNKQFSDNILQAFIRRVLFIWMENKGGNKKLYFDILDLSWVCQLNAELREQLHRHGKQRPKWDRIRDRAVLQ